MFSYGKNSQVFQLSIVIEFNKVAHEIARVAIQSKLSCNWVDEPPSFILASLVNDVMLFEDQ